MNISGGDENKNFYLSYSNNYEDGVLPTGVDNVERNTFNAKGELKVNKFSIKTSANYINRKGTLTPDGLGGSNSAANVYSDLLQIPRDISVVDHKDYKNNPFATPDYYFTWYADNPYYSIHENLNDYKENRFFGNTELSYEFIKDLKGIFRIGTDLTNYIRQDWEAINKYTPGSWNDLGGKIENPGYYAELFGKRQEIYADFLVQYQHEFSSDFGLNFLGGYNINQRDGRSISSSISTLEVPYWYNIKNSSTQANTATYEYKRRSYSVFGQVDLAYKNFAFLSLVARNDWSSTCLLKTTRSSTLVLTQVSII